MRSVTLQPAADLEGFRTALRHLIADEVPPENVLWDTQESLFVGDPKIDAPPVTLSRRVMKVIELTICHNDPERYASLYRFVWRLRHGEPSLLDMANDPLVHRLHKMETSVRRDIHKMHAFVRFRQIPMSGGDHFVAWFEPEHFILGAVAQFFVDRFTSNNWSILTPQGSLHWNRERLILGPSALAGDAPISDTYEAGWRAYFECIFNPARLNPKAMRSHMAKKYWKNLPETAAIPHLIQSASLRVNQMLEQELAVARKRNPDKAVAAMIEDRPRSLTALNRIILAAAPMVSGGTRAVLGEGPLHPDIAFVGEQPGDQEDIQGKPFVGPAGELLDRALEAAGIDRRQIYVTNAVKHFKFELRGKRRIHSKPNAGEVKHYRWWLEKELDFVKPKLTVALGATAAFALAGRPLSISANRGPIVFNGRPGFITIHPSFLLRMPEEGKKPAWKTFVADLKHVRKLSEEPLAA